ncbi:hypothetical protein, partial [uncultured Faecalibaculum sp.]|uniref:hypothetical protein n=1 Tax=uncultured Faecalibaculum sp. TaxID=1729681 RepID=UPI00271204FB
SKCQRKKYSAIREGQKSARNPLGKGLLADFTLQTVKDGIPALKSTDFLNFQPPAILCCRKTVSPG